MKSLLQTGCRWLAVYLLSLAGTVYVGENIQGLRLLADPIPTATEPGGGGGGGEERKCPDCTEGWLTISQYFGAIECNHGPELDTVNCPASAVPTRDCWEMNGSKPSPITGKVCKCYVCGKDPSNRCEADFLRWLAWCGYENVFNEGGKCEVAVPVGEIDLYRRDALTPPDDPACKFGDNGHVVKRFCGIGRVDHFGCKSSNCRGEGKFRFLRREPKYRCKGKENTPTPLPPLDP